MSVSNALSKKLEKGDYVSFTIRQRNSLNQYTRQVTSFNTCGYPVVKLSNRDFEVYPHEITSVACAGDEPPIQCKACED